MKLSVSFSRLFVLLLLLLSHINLYSVNALNVGMQFANAAIDKSVRQCSRTCESQHCTVLPFLRYGKYCGILYTGCPGEKPCDALDACCMVHDDCIGSKNNDYLDEECNGQMVECIEKVKASGAGQATFKGNQCSVEEVADLVEALLEAALLARRVIHNP
ncbi:phospholipase A2-alpha-like [Zingiber officinale]|uniref:phospholipase A2-alpha-like n=1 Tax=Zingiber officinale TaxID=94328 RepID=UPI001C4D26CA|nr:phospholipase A2-alpha-like [Zingiber officinale]